MSKKQTGVVEIHGREYHTVASRIPRLWNDHPDWSISTDIIHELDDLVRMKCTICDETGRVRATGTAQESQRQSRLNSTSHIENAETSCVGRALSMLGYGGSEIASADEVASAITEQKESESIEWLMSHNKAVRENLQSIVYVKDGIANEDLLMAAEGWDELENSAKEALWVAPSKGGVFTTKERAVLKSDEFAATRKELVSEGQ